MQFGPVCVPDTARFAVPVDIPSPSYTQLNVAGTSAGWVSRDPKALAEAREKLSLSFVIM